MSVIQQPRGEAGGGGGGGVAAHLQCPLCGSFSKTHAYQLSHMAFAHPTYLDDVTMGRLGNVVMYQNGVHLFHCAECFFTSRDFNKLYQHIIAKHCLDEAAAAAAGGAADEEDNGSEKGDKEADEEAKEADEEAKEADEEAKEADEEVKEEMKEVTKVDKDPKEANEEDEATPPRPNGGAEVKDEDGTSERSIGDADESVLLFDGDMYHCLICGCWKNKLKGSAITHAVRKHSIPRALTSQRIRQDDLAPKSALTPKRHLSGGAEEEEEDGLSADLLKEEMTAMDKVVHFRSNRYVCVLCGWKAKMKGFTISHVVRCHDVERPYGCKDCPATFFLPSRLQQHIRAAHRPGRYACPFCSFRSNVLAGFRRHCSRCTAREEGERGVGLLMGEEGRGAVVVKEESKETRAGRKRARRLIEEAGGEDEMF